MLVTTNLCIAGKYKVRGRASKVRERRAIGARLDHVGYRQPVHAAHTERCASIGFTL